MSATSIGYATEDVLGPREVDAAEASRPRPSLRRLRNPADAARLAHALDCAYLHAAAARKGADHARDYHFEAETERQRLGRMYTGIEHAQRHAELAIDAATAALRMLGLNPPQPSIFGAPDEQSCNVCAGHPAPGHPHLRHDTCVNCGEVVDPEAPFGTCKESGRSRKICDSCIDWDASDPDPDDEAKAAYSDPEC